MNLTQLKANGYKVFNRQKPENKAANISALQYIESVAARTNVDILSWNLLELFGGPGRSEFDLLKDKNEINKIFFEHEAKLREDGDASIQEIKEMVARKAKEISDVLRNRRVSSLERDYTSHVQNADQYGSRMNEYLRSANVIWKQIQDIKRQSSNIENEVVGVLRERFWKFRDFNGANVLYETVSDIVLTEINPAAGLDLRANLGKFVAEVTLENMNLRMYPLSTIQSGAHGVSVDGYFHPHVNREGGLCWGNAKTAAIGHQTRGELTKLMSLLASLLSSYSSENPYKSLAAFHAAEQEMERRANGQATQAEAVQGQTQQGQQLPPFGADPWGPLVSDGAGTIFREPFASGATNTILNGVLSNGNQLNQAALDAVRQQLETQLRTEQIIGRHVNGEWQVEYHANPVDAPRHEERSANAEVHQAIRETLDGRRANTI